MGSGTITRNSFIRVANPIHVNLNISTTMFLVLTPWNICIGLQPCLPCLPASLHSLQVDSGRAMATSTCCQVVVPMNNPEKEKFAQNLYKHFLLFYPFLSTHCLTSAPKILTSGWCCRKSGCPSVQCWGSMLTGTGTGLAHAAHPLRVPQISMFLTTSTSTVLPSELGLYFRVDIHRIGL